MRVQGRSRRLRRHTAWSFLAVMALVGAVMTAWIAAPASAATAFANPAFAAQWQAGEAITPNFWGPLSLAHDGQNEPYAEGKLADGTSGMRLVQYFDKARMELTNPATGTVTNGLLATELITGKLQLGDTSFQTLQPAGVPVAGDPDNIGPTYASISMNAATLLANTPTAAGSPTTRMLGATGTLSTYTGAYASDPQGTIAAYDADTQHNVPAAFSTYRTKAGLLTIGFAISEPFWSNVKVAGTQKDVLVQAFQRRVLTYTPTNPAAFQVEFGNIGQHYYTWRYQSPQTQITPTASVTATPSVTTTPTTVADITAPKFTGAPMTPYQTPYSFTVTWKTNEPASSEVLYGTSSNYETINNTLKGLFTYDHYVVITGLTPSGTYHYRIQSRDAAGNLTTDDQDRTLTLPAVAAVPKISAITIAKRSATTFTVTWQTDVASNSRIEYGLTNGVYDRFRPGDGSDPLTLTHTATAVSLEPGKVYYFRVVSLLNTPRVDASASDDGPTPFIGNTASTSAATSALTISGDLKATQDKAGGSLTFTFSTDRPASIIIVVSQSSKFDSGFGYIYGSADDFEGQRDYPYPFTRNLHDITGITLPAGTWYYRVSAYDELGSGVSDIKSITVT
ncbi:MAG: fibronectin type III domain-containing protein [Thermomicrobiales bacterium]